MEKKKFENIEKLKTKIEKLQNSNLPEEEIEFELKEIKKRLENITLKNKSWNYTIKNINPEKTYKLKKLCKFAEILWIGNYFIKKITPEEITEISKLHFNEFQEYFNKLNLYNRK